MYNVEYSFSDAGVSESTPKIAGDAKFRESIVLGTVRSKGEVGSAISRLRDDFAPGTYDVVRRNCNNFATQLAFALVKAQIPGWVNRLASIGACCRCLVPGPPGGAAAPGGTPRADAVQPYSGRGFSLSDEPGGAYAPVATRDAVSSGSWGSGGAGGVGRGAAAPRGAAAAAAGDGGAVTKQQRREQRLAAALARTAKPEHSD